MDEAAGYPVVVCVYVCKGVHECVRVCRRDKECRTTRPFRVLDISHDLRRR